MGEQQITPQSGDGRPGGPWPAYWYSVYRALVEGRLDPRGFTPTDALRVARSGGVRLAADAAIRLDEMVAAGLLASVGPVRPGQGAAAYAPTTELVACAAAEMVDHPEHNALRDLLDAPAPRRAATAACPHCGKSLWLRTAVLGVAPEG